VICGAVDGSAFDRAWRRHVGNRGRAVHAVNKRTIVDEAATRSKSSTRTISCVVVAVAVAIAVVVIVVVIVVVAVVVVVVVVVYKAATRTIRGSRTSAGDVTPAGGEIVHERATRFQSEPSATTCIHSATRFQSEPSATGRVVRNAEEAVAAAGERRIVVRAVVKRGSNFERSVGFQPIEVVVLATALVVAVNDAWRWWCRGCLWCF
jgi:hypothetical protein